MLLRVPLTRMFLQCALECGFELSIELAMTTIEVVTPA